MAKSPIRKTIEHLIKKVEDLENQVFGQRVLIDDLEQKLAATEESIKKMKEDPFGIGPLVSVPSVWPANPAPPPQPYQPLQPLQNAPWNLPTYHVCQPGLPDWAGSTYCTICGNHMSGATWTITSTTDGTTMCLADPASQSSSDVEPTLDLDISWIIPEDGSTK